MESLLDLFAIVKRDFCDLLNYKLRGDTIEIITGVPTLTSAAVSVFVSYSNRKFAISDGGWLNKREYNSFEIEPESGEYIDRIIDQYKGFFSIKTLNQPNGNIYYYRTTTDINLVSAAVHDVAHFVANVVNTQYIAIKAPSEESEQRKLFHNKINGYLRQQYGSTNVVTNDLIRLEEDQSVRVNATLRIKDNRSLTRQYYLMYVTGQRPDQFIKDTTKATVSFKIIQDFAVEGSFYQRIAVINKSALGYDKIKSRSFIRQLEAVADQEFFIDIDSNIEELLRRLPPHNN